MVAGERAHDAANRTRRWRVEHPTVQRRPQPHDPLTEP